MAINLASKLAGPMAMRFTRKSITEGKMSTAWKWNGVRSITILTPTTTALVDYTRSGDLRYGSTQEIQDTKQDLAIAQDKAFNISVDNANLTQQEFLKQKSIVLNGEIDEQVVPTIETYRFNHWAAGAGTSVDAVVYTKDTIYPAFVEARKVFVNNNVPMGTNAKNYAYVTADIYALLLNNPLFLAADKLNKDVLEKGVVGWCAGFAVIEVPTALLGSRQALFVNKKAVLSPMQLQSVYQYDHPKDIDGWVAQGHYLFDAFVVDTYKMGVYELK